MAASKGSKGSKGARGAKGAKGRGGAAAAGPRVVLYGVDAKSEHGALVCKTIEAAGAEVRHTQTTELSSPVGAFAGLKGFHPARVPFEGEAPDMEFMLLCNFARPQMDALLNGMREAGCAIGCKATVTPTNRFWPLSQLIAQVSREHAQMTGAGADEDGAEGASTHADASE